jgi:hypothetical protein
MKTLSEELEFRGSGDPYIEVFGVPEAPPSYYIIYSLNKFFFLKKVLLFILKNTIPYD